MFYPLFITYLSLFGQRLQWFLSFSIVTVLKLGLEPGLYDLQSDALSFGHTTGGGRGTPRGLVIWGWLAPFSLYAVGPDSILIAAATLDPGNFFRTENISKVLKNTKMRCKFNVSVTRVF